VPSSERRRRVEDKIVSVFTTAGFSTVLNAHKLRTSETYYFFRQSIPLNDLCTTDCARTLHR